MDRHEMGMHGMDGGGGGFFEVIGSLIGGMFLLGALVLVLWAASRLLFTRSGGGESTDAAENILRERFARGEMQPEEFERSLEVLRANSSATTDVHPPGDEPPQGRYESYVRDALRRLRPGRGPNS